MNDSTCENLIRYLLKSATLIYGVRDCRNSDIELNLTSHVISAKN